MQKSIVPLVLVAVLSSVATLGATSALGGLQNLKVAAAQSTSIPITSNTIPNMVSQANPAVVQINATQVQQVQSQSTNGFFFGPQGNQPTTQDVAVLGSGFVISSNGEIVTNDHVVNNAKNIKVTVLGYSNPFPATVVGTDYNLDLAVLKINAPKALPHLNFASSSAQRIGEWVVAIGMPYGLSHTVTAGVISATGRPLTIGNRTYRDLLQTDAAINPGNSGGPLLNLEGQVVGVNTAVSTQGQGLGFAIPSQTVLSALPYLEQGKTPPVAWLGLGVTDVSAAPSQITGYTGSNGVLVLQVSPGGPAATAGVKAGDIILAFNGQPTDTADQLIEDEYNVKVGQTVVVKIWRHGTIKSFDIVMGAMPAGGN